MEGENGVRNRHVLHLHGKVQSEGCVTVQRG